MKATLLFLSVGMMISGVSCTSVPPQASSTKSPANASAITLVDIKKARPCNTRSTLFTKMSATCNGKAHYYLSEEYVGSTDKFTESLGVVETPNGKFVIFVNPNNRRCAVVRRG